MVKKLLALVSLFAFVLVLSAQTKKIGGRIIDPNSKEALIGASVLVKGTTVGTSSDINGFFTLEVPTDAKILVVSYVGYVTKEVPIGNLSNLSISLESSQVITQDVVVTGTRLAETVKTSSVQIEKMTLREIRNAASGDFYQNLSNFKGVDLVTTSFGFKVINLRGFASTNSGRSLQLIDGIDNQAPGLNFPVGNLVGINDLDLQSVEVISGPASAIYGPNALQGVISMKSRNPYDAQGLSAQVKVGATTAPAPYFEGQWRYAQAFGKEKKWAFKLTGSFMQTKDWVADDDSFNHYGRIYTTQDITAILRKKALDPVSATFTQADKDKLVALNNWLDFNPVANPGNLDIVSPGFQEKEITDYKTSSMKLAGELHYKIDNNTEVMYEGRFGMGTAVYQSVSRYQLKDIIFMQHKLELKGRNYYLRGYMTMDDAGKSYDIRRTGIYISRGMIPDYITNFNKSYFDSLRLYTNDFNADNEAKNWMVNQARPAAINYANEVSWSNSTSAKFDSLRNVIVKDPRGQKGTLFLDHSALYHIDGQYTFDQSKYIDVLMGANYRLYLPFSQGTIFEDTLINKGDTLANGFPDKKGQYNRIKVHEFGGIVQLSTKNILKDKLKLIGSLRVDKNSNYKVQFSPRIAAVVNLSNHVFRIGYSTAFKSPTLQEQYLDLDLGVIKLVGNRNGITNLYTNNSVIAAQDYLNAYTDPILYPGRLDSAAHLLKTTQLKPLQPEHVQSLDLGYRGSFIDKKLNIDLAGYFSIYKNFIGFTRVVQPIAGKAGEVSGETDVIVSLGKPTKYYSLYQAYINSEKSVPAWGASIALSYYVGKGISPYINYTYADLKEDNLTSASGDLILSGFNAPHHKINVGVMGYRVWKGLGFSANFKWIDSYQWQSSFGDGKVPMYHLLDAQISYEFDKLYSTLRIGGSNIYNNKHIEAIGSPKVGALYYVSWTFDYSKFLKL